MKIRTITFFCNPGWPLDQAILEQAGKFLTEACAFFSSAGFEVQTTRLATIPFPVLLGANQIHQAPELARQLSTALHRHGIAYASLGPALPEFPQSFSIIPEAINEAANIFFAGIMADSTSGISIPAVRACAETIIRCAPLSPDGFTNLRFAALANVRAGSPFFPAAYHSNSGPAFALGLEAADLALQAFSDAASISDGQHALASSIEKPAGEFSLLASKLASRFHVTFTGLDFPLAPFPDETISIGAAMEKMGVPMVGLHGSLAAAAILTEAIERARFQRAGFNGLFLPVMEDSLLARRVADKALTIKDLLLFSAVCGTGLDTIPLPGDTTADQITALLLDLSALALRLDKQLTARLMPIPGKKAGDPTSFQFDYFENSRVMSLEAQVLHAPFSTSQNIHLSPRHG